MERSKLVGCSKKTLGPTTKLYKPLTVKRTKTVLYEHSKRYTNMLKNTVSDYLVPSKLEVLLYFFVAVAIVFVANLTYITTYLLNQTGNVPQTGEDVFRMYSDKFFEFIEGLTFVPSSAVFIFWSLTGLFVFSLAQSVYNVYAEVKNDVNVDTHFMHPSNYTRWRFWGEVFVQFSAHILLYGLIVLWGMLMGFVLTPLVAILAQRLFADTNTYSLVVFAASFSLLYVGVLIFALLAKLFFKRKQLMI